MDTEHSVDWLSADKLMRVCLVERVDLKPTIIALPPPPKSAPLHARTPSHFTHFQPKGNKAVKVLNGSQKRKRHCFLHLC